MTEKQPTPKFQNNIKVCNTILQKHGISNGNKRNKNDVISAFVECKHRGVPDEIILFVYKSVDTLLAASYIKTLIETAKIEIKKDKLKEIKKL